MSRVSSQDTPSVTTCHISALTAKKMSAEETEAAAQGNFDGNVNNAIMCIAAIANLKWSTARFAIDLAVKDACMCWNVSIMIAKKRPVGLVPVLVITMLIRGIRVV